MSITPQLSRTLNTAGHNYGLCIHIWYECLSHCNICECVWGVRVCAHACETTAWRSFYYRRSKKSHVFVNDKELKVNALLTKSLKLQIRFRAT